MLKQLFENWKSLTTSLSSLARKAKQLDEWTEQFGFTELPEPVSAVAIEDQSEPEPLVTVAPKKVASRRPVRKKRSRKRR